MKPEKKEEFKLHLAELFQYLQKELKLTSSPKVVLNEDQKNADKILGKTGYYDPRKKSITLYTTDRHPKDILRSFSHEAVHHWQHEHNNLEPKGDKSSENDPQYAQNNPWLRQMEKQAYLLGNILFRDWEDIKKNSGRKSGKKMVQEQAGKIFSKPEDAPSDGTKFVVDIKGKKFFAYWKGALYNLNHPAFGGTGGPSNKKPIFALVDKDGNFIKSIFTNQLGKYGIDWYVQPLSDEKMVEMTQHSN